MLDNRNGHVVGKQPDSIISGSRVGPSDKTTSSKSPLEFRILSPRCSKNWDIGGIGLGFVAALENCGSDIPVMGGLNVTRSAKISTKRRGDSANCGGGLGCWESCTSVTSNGPNKSFTRVYFDGNAGRDTRDFDKKLRGLGGESSTRFIKANRNIPISDFLSSCYKCGKMLHGRDIYMYRGDKAFCSVECRSTQIVIDQQRKKKCGSDVSRSAEVSGGSPYSGDQLFSIDIIVS